MRRGVVVGLMCAMVLAGVVLASNAVRQEREFRRLVAAGDAAFVRDQTFEAIEDFSGALALKSDSMLAHLKRGDSYRRRGELTAALRDLRDAAALDPTATRPLELLGDVDAEMGRYERAIDAYRRCLTLDDRAPRVLYKLALALYRNGQAARAIDPLRRALNLDARFVEAHYLLGVCLRDRKQTAAAADELNRAIALNPAFGPAREQLADLELAQGKVRDGIEQLEALAALEPTHPERLVNVALAYSRFGRIDGALATMGRAAERYPDAEVVQVAVGRVWLEDVGSRGDDVALRRATEALRPIAARATATGDALALYGRALLFADDLGAAERTLERATATLPVDPVAYLDLSTAAERLGHLAAAREALAKYVSLVDKEEEKRTLAARAANLSLRLQDAPAAVAWLQRAFDDRRRDPGLLARLADAQIRAGQTDAARMTVEEGLRLDPRHRALLQIRRRIGT